MNIMTAKNDITGDRIRSKISTDLYRDNWEKIFMPESHLFLVVNDDHVLIITDWNKSENNKIRLNRAQYAKLKRLILQEDEAE